MSKLSRFLLPGRRRRTAIITSAVIGCLAFVFYSPAPNPISDSTKASPSLQTACCNDDDNKPHLLIASYYTVKNHVSAKLLLNNKGPHPLDAHPTLFSANGERFDAPTITVDPQSFRMIDVHDWVHAAGPQFREGSVQIFHLGRDLVLGAQVYLADEERSLSFDEKLVELGGFKSSRLNGLWWLPSPAGKVRLILSNTSAERILVTAQADGERPQRIGIATVELAPHETRVMDVQDDLLNHEQGAMSRFGSVSIQHSGVPGAILARGMAMESSVGYSFPIQFADPSAAKSSQLQGVGLRIGRAGQDDINPIAVARNIGTTPSVITGRVAYPNNGSTETLALPQMRLAPGEMTTVNIARVLRERGRGHVNTVGGVEFEYSTSPGTVIMSALSVSDDGNQMFRVPMWDIAAQRSSTGGYPWYVDGDSSTMVYIKNTSEEPQRYFLQLNYPGGVYAIGMKKIEGHETVTVDLRLLRDAQVPDNHGRVIPPSTNYGQVHWSANGTGVLIGRSEQADLVKRISSNYACQNCCGDFPYLQQVFPGTYALNAGTSYGFMAQEQFNTCYGQLTELMDVSGATWTSSNSAVATVDANGNVTTHAPGTATISAHWSYEAYHYSPVLEECVSNTVNVTQTSTITVIGVTWTTPHSLNGADGIVPIASGTPPQGSPAFVNSTTIAATGSPSGGTYSWSTSSNKVSLSNATSATVTVTGSTESQSTRDVTITVTYTYSGASVSSQVPFTVQKPTFMEYVSVDGSGSATECDSGQSGRYKDMTWQLTDKNHNPINFEIPTYDTMNNGTPNSCGAGAVGAGTPPGSSTTTGGRWGHHYHVCSSACNNGGSCSVTGTQKYFSNGFEIDLTYTMSCASITVAGH